MADRFPPGHLSRHIHGITRLEFAASRITFEITQSVSSQSHHMTETTLYGFRNRILPERQAHEAKTHNNDAVKTNNCSSRSRWVTIVVVVVAFRCVAFFDAVFFQSLSTSCSTTRLIRFSSMTLRRSSGVH